jgi:hypothetical protein
MSGYLGNTPTSVPLSSADFNDGIITSAKIANGAITGDDINSTFNLTGKTVTLPAGTGGKVLQVVSTTKTDTFTTTSTTLTDITGLSLSITPSSASNKILVFADISSSTLSGRIIAFTLKRGTTSIGVSANTQDYGGTISQYHSSNADTGSIINNSLHFYDSPSSTSALTYKIQTRVNIGDTTVYINNRSSNDSSTVSSITAIEIAG